MRRLVTRLRYPSNRRINQKQKYTNENRQIQQTVLFPRDKTLGGFIFSRAFLPPIFKAPIPRRERERENKLSARNVPPSRPPQTIITRKVTLHRYPRESRFFAPVSFAANQLGPDLITSAAHKRRPNSDALLVPFGGNEFPRRVITAFARSLARARARARDIINVINQIQPNPRVSNIVYVTFPAKSEDSHQPL